MTSVMRRIQNKIESVGLKKAAIAAINILIFDVCKLFPINERLIVFESDGYLCDNAYALYDYLRQNGFLKKYKAVWLVDNVECARANKYESTDYVIKNPIGIEWKRAFYLATCKWYLYDHCNLLRSLNKRKSCISINLWHGCAFKRGKGDDGSYIRGTDKIFITGKVFVETQMDAFNCGSDKLLDIGYPRNDYLFETIGDLQMKFKRYLGLENYKKVFLWMPTFRKSDNPSLSEDYFSSATGLPILEQFDELKNFNDFLRNLNCLCVFKVHHLQSEMPIYKQNYSNIILLKDENIKQFGLQLYQVLPLMDCLITDYSSVATDYMLLNRPIIYTLDDYEEYKKSRGFIPDDPIDYFAGYHASDEAMLRNAIREIADGIDKYAADRERIMPSMHTWPDGNTSKRVIEYLNL